MDLKIIFEFLIELQVNNSRVWFKKNNDRYQKAKLEFEQLIEILIPKIKQIDKDIEVSSAKECVFRIFKDVRFSKDKQPYKTNFGAYIAKGGGKSPNAGYYVHFEPDNSFIGGGIYMPEPKILKSIRTEIFENTKDYKDIINNKEFKKYFSEIAGEKLKSAPRGFSKDFVDIDLLKNKHYAVTYSVNNSFWYKKNLIDNISDVFKKQYKFNQFLNNVVNKKVND
ncbi:MAG: DUF2461 domain-containing protein [Bacteroidetes bacterium]|nr:DUF2461 domain-containing protein [Bacteroidota bacterium]